MQGVALDVGAPPGVVGGVGAPVQRRRDDVVPALRVRVVVPAALGDVDLAGLRPFAVDGVAGQHPDRWPEPVAGGELGGHFDAAVFDGGAVAGGDTAGAGGGHGGAVGDVGGGEAVGEDRGGAAVVAGEVDDAVAFDEGGFLEAGFDHQHAVLDEDVFVRVGGLFELAVAEAADFGFFEPGVRIEAAGKVLVEHGAVFVVDDGAEAVIDQKAGDGEAEEEAD